MTEKYFHNSEGTKPVYSFRDSLTKLGNIQVNTDGDIIVRSK